MRSLGILLSVFVSFNALSALPCGQDKAGFSLVPKQHALKLLAQDGFLLANERIEIPPFVDKIILYSESPSKDIRLTLTPSPNSRFIPKGKLYPISKLEHLWTGETYIRLQGFTLQTKEMNRDGGMTIKTFEHLLSDKFTFCYRYRPPTEI